MDFDRIMQEITAGLTGNATEDVAYLMKQAESHKAHPLAKEIARACGRLIFDLMPNDRKAEFEKVVGNESAGISSTLDEIRFVAHKRDFAKALALIEVLISKIETRGAFADDAVSEYHTFNELFEEILFFHLKKPVKQLRQAQLPYAEIYALHGSILFELKRFSEAKHALEKAIRWNPINAAIAFEHAEVCKMLGGMDEYLRLTMEIMAIAFKPQDIARGFRNLGYYFAEMQLYDVAAGCLHLSLAYEKESSVAQSELYYIQRKVGARSIRPTEEQLRQHANHYGFPIGASNDVLGLAYAYGKQALKDKESDRARYFLEIVYGLTDDEEVGTLLESLPGRT